MARWVTLTAAAFMLVAVSVGTAQSPKEVDYETFCKLPDVQAKRTAFLAASPDNRTNLVRTQLERWRDANRSGLTTEQLAGLTELIASIRPETYSDGPQGEEQRVKARAVAEKQRQLFTDAQIQTMQPYGPCIAKSK